MNFGKLETSPTLNALDLLAAPTVDAIKKLNTTNIFTAPIDPNLADTTAFCEHYNIPLDHSANCVILEASRTDRTWLAACLVLANTRADVNGLVRRHLDARRVSFASMDKALAETKMEYGGITPIGLPASWPLLIDSRVTLLDWVVVGSGIRGSKLIAPGKVLADLPNVVVLENLAKEI